VAPIQQADRAPSNDRVHRTKCGHRAGGIGTGIVPTIDFSAMKLEIAWARTNAEIEEIRERYGAKIEQEGHRRIQQIPEGFAVLVRRGSELVCRLWILKPKNVDDQRTTALGHELLHCLLGNYHPV